MRWVSKEQIAEIAFSNGDKDIDTVHRHTRSLSHKQWNIPLKMNQRAYISASLRFLASTIISCNSTDTSSERMREKRTERDGERGKKRKREEAKRNTLELRQTETEVTQWAPVDQPHRLIRASLIMRQFALPVDQLFVPAIMMNHQWLHAVSAYC